MLTFRQGDCRDILRTMPDQSVHCCVTSPPYFGLRDYGIDGQIGLETTPDAFVAEMVAVFREVRRVLRDDGTLWLNLGDSYATQGGRGEASMAERGNPSVGARTVAAARGSASGTKMFAGIKPKDLIGIPWRVAFALQADGWYLRQDIIWSKPNPMPESVTDRCTKAHEYIFLLSKNARYFYDAEAIAEPASYDPEKTKFPDGWDTGPGGHGSFHRNGREKGRASGNKIHKAVTEYERSESEEHRTKAVGRQGANANSSLQMSGKGGFVVEKRNKRSVWEVTTQPFREAHFATFPTALIEPCIKAGCSIGGTVLDPFAGAGTTGMVADRLQRNALLIELNPAYAAMMDRRIRDDAGMFAEVRSC
jgi:DNA modification methylase